MRHGEAASMAATDDVRPLTRTGLDQSRRAALSLKEKTLTLDLILASPLLRAQQTASEVTSIFPLVVETSDLITPESSPRGIIEYLEERFTTGSQPTVLLISHQPLASLLIEYLTGEIVSMSTANIAGIQLGELDRHQGSLQWVI